MEFNEYQRLAMRTASGETVASAENLLDTAVLGLNGEAGEIADLWKKYKYHAHLFDEAKLMKELGDILWYVACAAEGLGMTMDELASMNIGKLKKRYPEGFDADRSINRDSDDV